MTERRPEDDAGRALARALADDRSGSKGQRDGTMLFDAIARGVVALGRAARSAVRHLRSLSR